MPLISAGDKVICLLPPAVSPSGLPEQLPRIGQRYTLVETYSAPYGIGCKLEELDAFPYKGYVFWAFPENALSVAGGWYFSRISGLNPLDGRLRSATTYI